MAFAANTDCHHMRVRELLRRSKGENVLVLGGGITGRAVAALLSKAGYSVTVVDEKALSAEVQTEFSELSVKLKENYVATEESLAELRAEKFALAVLSPGVGLESPLAVQVSKANIPKLSEVDLAVAYLGMPDIAVTGTNGKTTTVHLIHRMLEESGINAALVGNVGKPFVSLIDPLLLQADKTQEDLPVLVAEVSSYQLEGAFDFVPHIGVLLNVDEDHLERHSTLDEYLRIKSRIFSGQSVDEDWSIIGIDDPIASRATRLSQGRLFPFGLATGERLTEQNGCFFSEWRREILYRREGADEVYSLAKWKLFGRHNRLNAAAAISAARLAGATAEAVQKVIDEFAPLPHRLEVVGEYNGVLYINDSKATNVSSARAAIETVREESHSNKLILLFGGLAKEGSWEPIEKAILSGTKAIVTFGADRAAISKKLQSPQTASGLWGKEGVPCESVETLGAAVKRAHEMAVEGSVVLLAPACASFDAYASYAARGEHFREIVKELHGESCKDA